MRHHSLRSRSTSSLECLKRQLLNEQIQLRPDERYYPWLRNAADEAASIAWTTAFPLLFLPALLEEKFEIAAEQAERQADIQKRSRVIQVFAQ